MVQSPLGKSSTECFGQHQDESHFCPDDDCTIHLKCWQKVFTFRWNSPSVYGGGNWEPTTTTTQVSTRLSLSLYWYDHGL